MTTSKRLHRLIQLRDVLIASLTVTGGIYLGRFSREHDLPNPG
ncbi:MAG: hypothetical protein RIE73_17430 [Coleofasciculus sp. C1-SOL-03]